MVAAVAAANLACALIGLLAWWRSPRPQSSGLHPAVEWAFFGLVGLALTMAEIRATRWKDAVMTSREFRLESVRALCLAGLAPVLGLFMLYLTRSPVDLAVAAFLAAVLILRELLPRGLAYWRKRDAASTAYSPIHPG